MRVGAGAQERMAAGPRLREQSWRARAKSVGRGCDEEATTLERLRRRQCCSAESDETPRGGYERGGRRVGLLEVVVVVVEVEVIDSR